MTTDANPCPTTTEANLRAEGRREGLLEAFKALREAHQKHNLDLQKDQFWEGKASGYGDSWQIVRMLQQGAVSDHTQMLNEREARLKGEIAGLRDTVTLLKAELDALARHKSDAGGKP